ncbi:MAG: YlmH/Sll1252 family protein [Eubacterium sp.]|nr:YlmH/Sll1252 family protein [Eubacterium sp.]
MSKEIAVDKKDSFLLARLEDACEKNYAPQFFDFYDEAMQAKMTRQLQRSGEPFAFFGGMAEAGRKMLCIYPEYVEADSLEWPMLALRFQADFPLEHRNILGELMGMGITRECIGDINVDDGEVQVIFVERLRDFMAMNFTRVKGRSIKPEFYPVSEIKGYALKFKRLELVAASDRLDGIINKIWGFSRQDSLTYIRQRRVRVNYEEVEKNDFRVKSGDVIALRGKGKARVVSLGGQTKKGKLRLVVDRYV